MWCVWLVLVLCVLSARIYAQETGADCLTADGSIGHCVESSKCMNSYHQENTVLCRYSRGYGTQVCCPRTDIWLHRKDSFHDDGPIAFPEESYSPHSHNQKITNSYAYNPSLGENIGYRPQNSRPSNYKPQYHEKPSYTQSNYNERPQYGGRPTNFEERPNYSSGYGGYEERPSYVSGSGSYNSPSHSGGSSYEGRPVHSGTGSGYNGRPDYSGGSIVYQENPDYPSYNERPNYSSGSQGIGGSSRRPDSYRPRPGSHINTRETTTSWEYPSDRRTTPQPSWAIEDNNNGGSSSSSRGRISEQKCEEYSRPVSQTINALPLSINAEAVPLRVQNCDFSAVKLIVGGEASELGEFPHMAAVGFKVRTSRDILWNCGGTLISKRYVLTAGHCTNTSFGNPVTVRLGEYNIKRDNDGADPQDYGVQQVIVHPNYFKTLKYNDIALLKLDREVTFNKNIRPACLPTDNNIRGRPIATGWGRTDYVGRQSDILMKVPLNVIDNRQCNNYYNTNNPGSSSFGSGIVDTMLCAGYVEGGRDTCLGDSGGPLTTTKRENPCIHYVVGITSFGKICAAPKSPGVYTRVVKYLDWIERVVWP
ncbi:serine protease Hayan-like isoform X1 [Macrosteles quadrilineatus]|uniref:serine protease Hayan-like isoform X1 n=1 Tax=Macrosteles quadrilineatus TaxID=74068 RepID=UPI0023E12F8D|nr:serine protease Hayan-like isoform X1 [Macrosteles quadrilineatus]